MSDKKEAGAAPRNESATLQEWTQIRDRYFPCDEGVSPARTLNDDHIEVVREVAADKEVDVEERILAMTILKDVGIGDRPELLEFMLNRINDENEAGAVRARAIDTIELGHFGGVVQLSIFEKLRDVASSFDSPGPVRSWILALTSIDTEWAARDAIRLYLTKAEEVEELNTLLNKENLKTHVYSEFEEVLTEEIKRTTGTDRKKLEELKTELTEHGPPSSRRK